MTLTGVKLTALDAHLLRRVVGLTCITAGVWHVAGAGWACIVLGVLILEPWRVR